VLHCIKLNQFSCNPKPLLCVCLCSQRHTLGNSPPFSGKKEESRKTQHRLSPSPHLFSQPRLVVGTK
jgi:hypothetical protein